MVAVPPNSLFKSIHFVPIYTLQLWDVPSHICRYEVITGGWIMVVMDMLSPHKFQTLTKARKKLLPPCVFDDISEALKSLHKAGFVHGNICNTNMMVFINN